MDIHRSLPGQQGRAALAASLACAAAALCAPASAQDEPDATQDEGAAADGFAADAIIVMARRTEENIQDVPIAITAISGDALKAQSVADVTQLTRSVPGVSICCRPFNNATNTFIRGVAQGAPTYFAEVPVHSVGYGNFFDISSVEVLKGPQGTLFGQASNAGAFIYNPRRPGEILAGTVSAVVGNYDRRTIEAAVDLPVVEDHVFVRLAGIASERRGYVHDLAADVWLGDEDYWIARGSVIVRAEGFENYTLFQHSYAENTGSTSGIWVLDDFNFNTAQLPPATTAGLVALNGGTLAAYDALRLQLWQQQRALGPYQIAGLSIGCQNGPVFGPAMVTTLNYPNASCGHDYFTENRVINTTTIDISDDWLIKNIFGYSGGEEFRGPSDIDGTKLIILDTRSPRQENTNAYPDRLSNELQLQGTAGIFDVTAGLFYYHEKLNSDLIFNDTNVAGRSITRQERDSRSKAAYGQVNVMLDALITGLTATAGLRYTEDRIIQTTYAYNNTTRALISITGGPNSPAGNAEFDNLSYTLGLQWEVAPETMLFVTNSRGYNAGGLQNTFGFETFEPSVLTNYEAGFKSTFDLGDVRVRVNGSAFYGDFDDVQVNVFEEFQDSVTGLPRFGTFIKNAAKAKVRGFEVEGDVIPIDGLQLGGFASYTDNEYTEFLARDTITLQPIDLKDTPFVFVPKWKVGLRGSWLLPLPEAIGEVTLRGDWTRRTQLVNQLWPRTPTNPANPLTGLICTRDRTTANGYPAAVADGGKSYIDCIPPSSNLNLGVRWERVAGFDPLTLSFDVTNVTKNVVTDSLASLRNQGHRASEPAIPRMWTLRATYDF